MTIDDFLGHLQNVKGSGKNQWSASCPCVNNHSHGDTSQSLSVSFDPVQGKILLFCHKGCSTYEILEELNCNFTDLFIDDAPSLLRFIAWYSKKNELSFVEYYNYCYGAYLDGLAKVRFKKKDGEKTFCWVSSDSSKKSGFKLSHKDCPHRLYVAGSIDDEIIILAEGEKDANSINQTFKHTAVSAENGAATGDPGKKWLPEYTEQLTGKTVYVIGDNDEAGRNFAQVEAQQLIGHASRVYMMDLVAAWPDCPEKGDITDMIKSVGYSKATEIFTALMRNAVLCEPLPAPDNEPGLIVNQAKEIKVDSKSNDNYRPLKIVSASDLNSHEYKKPDYIVDGILYPGLTIFAGPPKYGKSFLSLDLACSVASGAPFLERSTSQGDVLYLDLEGTEWRTNERLSQLGYSLCPERLDHTYEADTVDNHLIRQLTEQIDSMHSPKLMIIDTMARVKGKVRRGEDGYAAEYRFLFPLHELALNRNVAIVCVTHTRKSGGIIPDDPMEMIHGSTAQYGTADNGWVLTGKREESSKILHCSGRDYEGVDLEVDFSGGKWVPLGTTEEMQSRRAAAKYDQDPTVKTIIHLVESSGGLWRGTMTDLINEVAMLTGQYPAVDSTRMGIIVRSYTELLAKRNHIITLTPSSARKVNGKSRKEYTFKKNGFAE